MRLMKLFCRARMPKRRFCLADMERLRKETAVPGNHNRHAEIGNVSFLLAILQQPCLLDHLIKSLR